VRDTMKIERGGRTVATVKKALVSPVATVKKALVSPLRERYAIEVEDGSDLPAKGNIVDHEYEFERDGTKWRRSRSVGSAYATRTESRLRLRRTTRSSS
jgi:uncharacterized protein YxjI